MLILFLFQLPLSQRASIPITAPYVVYMLFAGLLAGALDEDDRDVIVVASVSCIYGLGSPEAYHGMMLLLDRGARIERDAALRKLVEIQSVLDRVEEARRAAEQGSSAGPRQRQKGLALPMPSSPRRFVRRAARPSCRDCTPIATAW